MILDRVGLWKVADWVAALVRALSADDACSPWPSDRPGTARHGCGRLRPERLHRRLVRRPIRALHTATELDDAWARRSTTSSSAGDGRYRARPRRLRHPGRVRARGFAFIARATTTLILLARHGRQSVRDRLPRRRRQLVRSLPGTAVGRPWPRLADAPTRRRATDPTVSLTSTSWHRRFAHADVPTGELRDRFGITPKSTGAIAAGSVGPWKRAASARSGRHRTPGSRWHSPRQLRRQPLIDLAVFAAARPPPDDLPGVPGICLRGAGDGEKRADHHQDERADGTARIRTSGSMAMPTPVQRRRGRESARGGRRRESEDAKTPSARDRIGDRDRSTATNDRNQPSTQGVAERSTTAARPGDDRRAADARPTPRRMLRSPRWSPSSSSRSCAR